MQELEEKFKQSGGEFKEVKLTSLFGDADRGQRLVRAKRISGNIPLATAGEQNQGIAENINPINSITYENSITIDMFGNAFCRDYTFCADDNILIVNNSSYTTKAYLYITSCINKNKIKYSYIRQYRQKIYACETVILPFLNNELALDYMHDYIREIEHDYIREIDAYLKLVGLDEEVSADEVLLHSKDTSKLLSDRLSELEEQFKKSGGVMKEVNPSKFFNVVKINNIFNKSILQENGSYPVQSSNSINNGIIGYSDTYDFKVEGNDKFVLFGDHTRTLSIADYNFSVLDNVKVLKPLFKDNNVLLYIFTYWKKAIPELGYARHWKVAFKNNITIPFINDSIALDYMHEYIQEIEKFVVRDLILFKNKKLKAYKQAIKE